MAAHSDAAVPKEIAGPVSLERTSEIRARSVIRKDG
jgi:hypothetical protein